ncbi:NUDIX domain-containing protein [Micromonospora taraxaci]|uniref:NUDIX domain-containing protein n=1 Tax=Micromonospora taraxaci TaxID=1316803 RepID=UPI0033FC2254
MPKTDYLNDPEAPKANSLVVAVTVFVQDDVGRVLLIRRSDNRLWALPGGAQDLGESTAQAARREVEEETGLRVELTGVSGIYSDPGHVIAYDNGEVRQEFAVCLLARPIGGALRTSDESSEVRWVEPEAIEGLPIHPSMLLRIRHGLKGDPPYLA